MQTGNTCNWLLGFLLDLAQQPVKLSKGRGPSQFWESNSGLRDIADGCVVEFLFLGWGGLRVGEKGSATRYIQSRVEKFLLEIRVLRSDLRYLAPSPNQFVFVGSRLRSEHGIFEQLRIGPCRPLLQIVCGFDLNGNVVGVLLQRFDKQFVRLGIVLGTSLCHGQFQKDLFGFTMDFFQIGCG